MGKRSIFRGSPDDPDGEPARTGVIFLRERIFETREVWTYFTPYMIFFAICQLESSAELQPLGPKNKLEVGRMGEFMMMVHDMPGFTVFFLLFIGRDDPETAMSNQQPATSNQV